MEENNFLKVADHRGLTNQTITAMLKDDFDTEDAIKHMDVEEDLRALGIAGEQKIRLKKWVEELNLIRSSGDYSISSFMKSEEVSPITIDTKESIGGLKKKNHIVALAEEHIQKNGLKDLKDTLDRVISEFQSLKSNVCIVGEAAVGKSSLVQILTHEPVSLGKKATSKKQSKKAQVKPHASRHLPDTILWDYPATQIREASKNRSLKELPLELFDAMIICSCRRFSETDLWLAQQAGLHKLQVFYIRTKIDIDVTNEKRDRESDFDEEELLATIKKKVLTNLGQTEVADPEVFALSTVKEHKLEWDLPKFIKQMKKLSPIKNVCGLLENIRQSGKVSLKKLKECIAKNIHKSAKTIVQSEQNREELLLKELVKYRAFFEATESDIPSDTNVSKTHIDFNREVEESTRYRWIGIWFFGVGFLIGLFIDKLVTRSRLDELISELHNQCEQVLGEELHRSYDHSLGTFDTLIEELKTEYCSK